MLDQALSATCAQHLLKTPVLAQNGCLTSSNVQFYCHSCIKPQEDHSLCNGINHRFISQRPSQWSDLYIDSLLNEQTNHFWLQDPTAPPQDIQHDILLSCSAQMYKGSWSRKKCWQYTVLDLRGTRKELSKWLTILDAMWEEAQTKKQGAHGVVSQVLRKVQGAEQSRQHVIMTKILALKGDDGWHQLLDGSLAFVVNWMPCHLAISSFKTAFTAWCCLMTGKPLHSCHREGRAILRESLVLSGLEYLRRKSCSFKVGGYTGMNNITENYYLQRPRSHLWLISHLITIRKR